MEPLLGGSDVLGDKCDKRAPAESIIGSILWGRFLEKNQ